jgi:hypothetical protein
VQPPTLHLGEGLGAVCGLNGKVKVGLQGSWIGNRDG